MYNIIEQTQNTIAEMSSIIQNNQTMISKVCRMSDITQECRIKTISSLGEQIIDAEILKNSAQEFLDEIKGDALLDMIR